VWEILGPALAAFLLGLARGITVCLMLCAPGMIPLIINEKAGPLRSLFLGFLMSLPRILLLTALGAILGFLSYELFSQDWVQGAFTGISAASYILLGLLLVFVGIQLLREHEEDKFGKDRTKAAGRGKGKGKRGKEGQKGDGKGRGRHATGGEGKGNEAECAPKENWWQRLIFRVAKKLYPARGKSQMLFLLWGGLLSLACVGEISGEAGVLAMMTTNAAAGTTTLDPAVGAGIGALMLFIFSLGATVPLLITAVVGGSLSKRVKDKEVLATIRGASAMLMVGLGLYFFFREVYIVVDLAGVF